MLSHLIHPSVHTLFYLLMNLLLMFARSPAVCTAFGVHLLSLPKASMLEEAAERQAERGAAPSQQSQIRRSPQRHDGASPVIATPVQDMPAPPASAMDLNDGPRSASGAPNSPTVGASSHTIAPTPGKLKQPAESGPQSQASVLSNDGPLPAAPQENAVEVEAAEPKQTVSSTIPFTPATSAIPAATGLTEESYDEWQTAESFEDEELEQETGSGDDEYTSRVKMLVPLSPSSIRNPMSASSSFRSVPNPPLRNAQQQTSALDVSNRAIALPAQSRERFGRKFRQTARGAEASGPAPRAASRIGGDGASASDVMGKAPASATPVAAAGVASTSMAGTNGNRDAGGDTNISASGTNTGGDAEENFSLKSSKIDAMQMMGCKAVHVDSAVAEPSRSDFNSEEGVASRRSERLGEQEEQAVLELESLAVYQQRSAAQPAALSSFPSVPDSNDFALSDSESRAPSAQQSLHNAIQAATHAIRTQQPKAPSSARPTVSTAASAALSAGASVQPWRRRCLGITHTLAPAERYLSVAEPAPATSAPAAAAAAATPPAAVSAVATLGSSSLSSIDNSNGSLRFWSVVPSPMSRKATQGLMG